MILQDFIEIYSWIVASLIMVFVAAIANFYQKKFGVKTFYYFYLVPILILFAASAELFPPNKLLHESIEFTGSFSSFLASYFLYRTMMGVR